MMIKYLLLAIFQLSSFCQIWEAKIYQVQDDLPVSKNIYVGKIGSYSLIYDYYKYNQSSGEKIAVYLKNGKSKHILLSHDLAGAYIDEVSVKYLLDHPFVYIASAQTAGQNTADLYAIDVKNRKATQVKLRRLPKQQQARPYKKSLQFKRESGILIDEQNNITSTQYFVDGNGSNVTLESKYLLRNVAPNSYVLECIQIKTILADN